MCFFKSFQVARSFSKFLIKIAKFLYWVLAYSQKKCEVIF
jgi:hypothetical protein